MAENHLPRGDDLAQQENNDFEPLFKRRGNTATVISAIMVVISGATLFFVVKEKEKEFHFLVFTAALLTLSFVFGELFRRLSLLSEEFKHKRTRYQGKLKGIFKTTFTFDYGKCILVAAIASALILCYQLFEKYGFLSPRFRQFVFPNCFVVSHLLFLNCGSPTALSCGDIGFEGKRKQECS